MFAPLSFHALKISYAPIKSFAENHESFVPKITKVFVLKITKVFVAKITKVLVPKITKVFVPKQRNISYTRQKIMHCKKWK